MKFSGSICSKVAATALVLAAAGTTTLAQARSDVYFSIGANIAPGLNIGVANAPVYYPQPVYAPVYVQPAPVYVQPSTYYVRPAPVYVQPAPVFATGYYYNYGQRGHWRHERHQRQHRDWD